MTHMISVVPAVAVVAGLAAFAVVCVRHAWSDEFMHPDEDPLTPVRSTEGWMPEPQPLSLDRDGRPSDDGLGVDE